MGRTLWIVATAALAISLVLPGALHASPVLAGATTLTLSPASGAPGTVVQATGTIDRSYKNVIGKLTWDGVQTLGAFTVSGGSGYFSTQFRVPSSTPGTHVVSAVVGITTLSSSLFTVSSTTSTSMPTATAAPTSAPSATPVTSASAKSWGVNAHFQWYGDSDVATQVLWMQTAGLSSVRFDWNWSRLQPQRGVWDQTQLAHLDYQINLLVSKGLRPIVTFVCTPGWANAGAGCWTPPSNPDDYGQALGYLAARYASTPTAWEVWNEPDYVGFWKPSPDAAQYAALVKSAYRYAKGAAPGTTILAGSINHNDVSFLEGMYSAGVKGYFDALSIHPYCFNMAPDDPDTKDNGAFSFYKAIEDMESHMAAHGQPNMPIHITEMGWNTGSVAESTRATYMSEAVSVAKSYPYVQSMQPYVLHDPNDLGYALKESGVSTATWNAYASAITQ